MGTVPTGGQSHPGPVHQTKAVDLIGSQMWDSWVTLGARRAVLKLAQTGSFFLLLFVSSWCASAWRRARLSNARSTASGSNNSRLPTRKQGSRPASASALSHFIERPYGLNRRVSIRKLCNRVSSTLKIYKSGRGAIADARQILRRSCIKRKTLVGPSDRRPYRQP